MFTGSLRKVEESRLKADTRRVCGMGLQVFGILLLLSPLVAGCGKKGNGNRQTLLQNSPVSNSQLETPNSQLTNSSEFITFDEALAELRALEAPEGTDKELFNSLKVQLEKMLIGRGVEKFPSTPPSADTGNAIALVPDPAGLSWLEAREGDYNNDGIVKADDLVPLALHFGETSESGLSIPSKEALRSLRAPPLSLRGTKSRSNLPQSPGYYKYAEYTDGDGDGIVGIGDLQAIAEHFGESTIGYNVYEALDQTGLSSSKVATILRPSPPQDPDNPPWNISFAPLQYDTSQGVIEVESAATKQEQVTRSGTGVPPVKQLALDGQATPPLSQNKLRTNTLGQDAQATWSPMPGRYYSVVPYGQGFDEQGAPILVERTALASDWVYLNIPPVAIFEASPVSGEAPVTVTFDARDSYDADGYITNYLWDFDGDGLTDRVTQTPITTYEFTAPSVKPATLIIYDNTGNSSPKLSLPLHISGWKMEYIGEFQLAGPLLLTRLDGSIVIVGNWGGDLHKLSMTGDNFVKTLLIDTEGQEVRGSPAAISLSRDPLGRVFLAYLGLDHLIRFATYSDPEWFEQVVDYTQAESYASFQWSPQGFGALSYAHTYILGDYTPLYYATIDGGVIQREVVEEPYGGQWSSLGFDSDGKPSVAYYKRDTADLVFATLDDGEWIKELVDLGNQYTSDTGWFVELAFGPDGRPYITYMDSYEGIWLARKEQGVWAKNLVSNIPLQGVLKNGPPHIAVTSTGVFYLLFAEENVPEKTRRLKCVRMEAGAVLTTTLPTPAFTALDYSNLVLGEEGFPKIVAAEGERFYLFSRVE